MVVKLHECKWLVISYDPGTKITHAWPSGAIEYESIDRGIITYYSSVMLGIYHMYAYHKTPSAANVDDMFKAMEIGYRNFGKEGPGYKLGTYSNSHAANIIKIIENGKMGTTPYIDSIDGYHKAICNICAEILNHTCSQFLWKYSFNVYMDFNPVAKFFTSNPTYADLMVRMLISAIRSNYASKVWNPRPPYITDINGGKVNMSIQSKDTLSITIDELCQGIEKMNSIFRVPDLNNGSLIENMGMMFNAESHMDDDTNQHKHIMTVWLILSCACNHFDTFEVSLADLRDPGQDWKGLVGNVTVYQIRYTDPDKQSRFDHLNYFISESGAANYGFHGSMIGNWYSIFGNGIKVGTKEKGIHFNGSAYGIGVYLSDDANFSLSYSGARYGSNSSDNMIIMGIFQVDPSLEPYKKTTNIYVVPEPNDLCLKYIIMAPSKDITSNYAMINEYFANVCKRLHSSTSRLHANAALRRIKLEYDAYRSGVTVEEFNKQSKKTGNVRLEQDEEIEENNFSDFEDSDIESYEYESDDDSHDDSHDDRHDDSHDASHDDSYHDDTHCQQESIYEHSPNPSPEPEPEVKLEPELEPEPPREKPWFSVSVSTEMEAPGDITCWMVRVDSSKFVDPDEPVGHAKNTLYRQLCEREIKHVEFEVDFPDKYPMEPPFVRVLYPRFAYRTGHITLGGSICNQMLTRDGWSPALTLDKVMLDIVTNITNCVDDPNYLKTGKLDTDKWKIRYEKKEAIEAHTRMLATHKQDWELDK